MQHHTYICSMLCLLLLGLSHTASAQNSRWSSELSPEQQAQAEAILQEAAPHIKALRQELVNKIQELKNFSYNQEQDQQSLATLGHELHEQRQALRQALKDLDEKLIQELGVSLHGYRGRDCNNLTKERLGEKNALQKYTSDRAHHIDH